MTDRSWLDAPEAVYARVYRALIALGARPADASDALQDAFEHALHRPEQIERPEAWLFVVALRRWRRQRWRDRLVVPLDLLRAHPQVSPPGPNAAVLTAELKRLPQREREVIVARYVVGLSQRETAHVLGMAIGTVAATTSHAVGKLRRRLDELDRS